jgi:hypothetical protein
MDDRDLSRNASSSRAIPVNRLIEDVMTDPYIPIHWGANQKGMQAVEECKALIKLSQFIPHSYWREDVGSEKAWLTARDLMVQIAEAFAEAGYHKQIVNRLLEPWAHINVVATATNWTNFVYLRDHKDAMPEIQVLGRAVREALEKEPDQYLNEDQYHLPYVTEDEHNTFPQDQRIAFSVARCARVSYMTHDMKAPDPEEDLRLFSKLQGPPLHASPFEHQAHPDERSTTKVWKNPQLHGNLEGWCQYRKTLHGECQ